MPTPKPHYDIRPGTIAMTTMRFAVIALMAMAQYHLLTVSMEAFHTGETGRVVTCFVVSAICFALCAGLLLTGESGSSNR